MYKQIRNKLVELTLIVDTVIDQNSELNNFKKRVDHRVFGMLNNVDAFELHPCVLEHLEAIKKISDDMAEKGM